jgi:uncharacterized protein (DUF924 family)
MSDNEHQFRKLVSGLKIDAQPDPAHRQRLQRQMLQTFEQAAAAPPWSASLAKLSLAKLAIAAAVVVSAAVVVYQFRGPADSVAADLVKTREAMQKMSWIHVVTTKGQEVETRWHDLAADRVFLTTAQGAVMCWDNGPAQKQFVYNPRARTLMVDNLPRRGFSGSGSVLATLDTMLAQRQQDAAAVETYTDSYQNRKVRVFKAQMRHTGGEAVEARVIQTIMVDPRTRLVLAGSTDHLGKAGEVIARETLEVDYPRTGPASVYDLAVPASARIIDRTQQPIGTPGDTPTPAPTGE